MSRGETVTAVLCGTVQLAWMLFEAVGKQESLTADEDIDSL
jgi:hypothetical protein